MAEFIGQMIGPYRIMEQIGLGGMATVYKAYQASMDRYVAVKVLPRQFGRAVGRAIVHHHDLVRLHWLLRERTQQRGEIVFLVARRNDDAHG